VVTVISGFGRSTLPNYDVVDHLQVAHSTGKESSFFVVRRCEESVFAKMWRR
jgi:hypothetical protein